MTEKDIARHESNVLSICLFFKVDYSIGPIDGETADMLDCADSAAARINVA